MNGATPASSPTYQTSRLRFLQPSERPQEKLARLGPEVLSDEELLAMILRSGSADHDVLAVASSLLKDVSCLADLVRWTAEDFARYKGIGPVKSLQLVTIMEIAKRVLLQKEGERPLFDAPEKVYRYFMPIAAGLAVEKFWILCLTRKNTLLSKAEITSGTASSSLVHPREVFREAIRRGAVALIGVHNHPSGDPAPSAADIQVTRQLREAAKVVSIDFLDHVIIGDHRHDPRQQGFYSFRDAGIL